MTDRELMQQALVALEEIHPGNMTPMAEEAWNKAITALRERLAQPEQEPVKKVPGMAVQALAGEIVEALLADEKDDGYDLTAGMFGRKFSTLVRRWAQAEWASQLYTAPQQRRPLTDEQIKEAVLSDPFHAAALMSLMRDGVMVSTARDAIAGIARAIERAHGIGGEE